MKVHGWNNPWRLGSIRYISISGHMVTGTLSVHAIFGKVGVVFGTSIFYGKISGHRSEQFR